MEIRAKTIADAHKKVCREIFEAGDEIVTEDGELTFEYPEPIIIIINNPESEPRVSFFNNLKENALEEYKKQFISKSDAGFTYTYGNRMLDYPSHIIEFDQLEWIIHLLNRDPVTRRAIVTIRYPEIDCFSNSPPCLTTVQFFIRQNTLHCVAYFRSNDMLSAWCNNANGLLKLMEYIRKQLSDVKCGTLTTISANAHIYFKRDAEELKQMKKAVY